MFALCEISQIAFLELVNELLKYSEFVILNEAERSEESITR